VPILSRYTCYANSDNFPASAMSWSKYHSLSTYPRRESVACTPSRMRGRTIVASGCLHGDLTMGCFPFLLGGSLEVPTSICLSSTVDYGSLVMYSTRPFCCCADSALVGGVGVAASVCTMVAPFSLWDSLTLVGLCGLLRLQLVGPTRYPAGRYP
jgi:hypothetical protein